MGKGGDKGGEDQIVVLLAEPNNNQVYKLSDEVTIADKQVKRVAPSERVSKLLNRGILLQVCTDDYNTMHSQLHDAKHNEVVQEEQDRIAEAEAKAQQEAAQRRDDLTNRRTENQLYDYLFQQGACVVPIGDNPLPSEPGAVLQFGWISSANHLTLEFDKSVSDCDINCASCKPGDWYLVDMNGKRVNVTGVDWGDGGEAPTHYDLLTEIEMVAGMYYSLFFEGPNGAYCVEPVSNFDLDNQLNDPTCGEEKISPLEAHIQQNDDSAIYITFNAPIADCGINVSNWKIVTAEGQEVTVNSASVEEGANYKLILVTPDPLGEQTTYVVNHTHDDDGIVIINSFDVVRDGMTQCGEGTLAITGAEIRDGEPTKVYVSISAPVTNCNLTSGLSDWKVPAPGHTYNLTEVAVDENLSNVLVFTVDGSLGQGEFTLRHTTESFGIESVDDFPIDNQQSGGGK